MKIEPNENVRRRTQPPELIPGHLYKIYDFDSPEQYYLYFCGSYFGDPILFNVVSGNYWTKDGYGVVVSSQVWEDVTDNWTLVERGVE